MSFIKSFVEFLYYISGIGLLIIGLFGLRQLKIGLQQVKIGLDQVSVAKQDIEIRSRREAALLAVSQADTFCNEIIPLWNKLHFTYLEKGLYIYQGEIKEFNKNENDVIEYFKQFSSIAKRKLKQDEYNDIMQSITLLLNKLESIAIYFLNGIADERIIFNSISVGYRNIVLSFYPHICNSLSVNSTFYTNLRELYNLWESRTKENELKFQSELINKELDNIVIQDVNPIGNKVI